jgi:pimeloyl-ACP methyl ester carboxylesterase
MRKIYIVLLFFFVCSGIFAQNITEYTLPPAPLFRCGDAPAKLNQIVYGATPPNSADKPVVVFIHGWFDNGYSWFYAKNEWYQKLYNQNIRTAYLFQSHSGSFQENGKVVANMIRKICAKYNTNKVVAVCHSKGGFDIEWAMYNYGIHDSVSNVITLNTPYYGAPIVDLIANPFVRLITEALPIVGPIFQGAGTYQMTPAYMKGVVRPMMDNHPKNEPEKFRCYGTWGYQHATQLPNPISDDLLKVVLYDYKPLCFDIPGMSQIASGLMSFAMGSAGLITSIMPVQDAYQNPTKNTSINDGLAPYYSSFRPGSIEISERPNAESTNLNHIDVLMTKYTWNVVNNELQDIISGGQSSRKSKDIFSEGSRESTNVQSAMQWIDADNFDFNITENKQVGIMLLGNYKNVALSIFDENNKKVYTENINHETKTFWELFKVIDVKSLKSGKYTVKTNEKIKAIVIDESDAKLELKIEHNKIYLKTIAWNTNAASIDLQVNLNRNIDENGQLIWDRIIPIKMKYSVEDDLFVSDELSGLETGSYNVSAYAKNTSTQRFLSTSYYVNKENKQLHNKIKIYPNIAKDNCTIAWENAQAINSVEIYDIQGKLMQQIKVDNESNSLDINLKQLNINQGMYIVKVGNVSAKLMVAP